MTKFCAAVMSLALSSLLPAGCTRNGQGDSVSVFPILYDQRDLAEVQDVSGLEPGTHGVEFNAYVPSYEKWTDAREQQLLRGIRVAHVGSRVSARIQVGFTPVDGRADVRRVRVDMELDREGPWVMRVAGESLRTVAEGPELLKEYKVLHPEQLAARKDSLLEDPGVVLRTVGSCNHIHKVVALPDEDGVLRHVKVLFSEPLEKGTWSGELRMELSDVTRAGRIAVETVIKESTPESLVFDVPSWPDVHGPLKVHLGSRMRIAGGFSERLSCAPSEAIVDVGYAHGDQPAREHLVAPLFKAANMAFAESK